MKRVTTLFMLVAGITFASTPLLVQAAQITPNPNPAGSTIDIINDPFAVNNDNPYVNAGRISIDATSALTNSVGATLDNSGVMSAGSFSSQFGSNGTLTNAGTLYNSGTLSCNGCSLINSGTMINGIGGNLYNSLNYNNKWINDGTLINNGYFQNGISALINNGTLTNNRFGTLNCGECTLTNNGTLTNSGTVSVGGSHGALLTNYGTLTNYGMVTGSFLQNDAGGLLTNYGTVSSIYGLTNSGTMINNGTVSSIYGLTNSGTMINNGTLTNDRTGCGGSCGTLINNGTLTNAGLLSNDGWITGTGTYTQTAGHTMNNGSLSQLGGVNIQGGLLTGTGTITGPVTIGSGATVSPGNSPGTLIINGNLSSSGNLLFQIGGLASGLFDVLKINGDASFTGGNITFDFINGFIASARDSWDFLYASAITGWDTLTFTINGLRPNQAYAFSYANGVETLTVREVHRVPEPSSFLLLAVGLVGLAAWRWKRAV